MAKSRTVSLKGPAAAAFVGMLAGKPAETEDEVLTRAATLVHMYVKTNQMSKAVAILKDLQATGKVPENA
jgi:pentatricopeptide repeat protein